MLSILKETPLNTVVETDENDYEEEFCWRSIAKAFELGTIGKKVGRFSSLRLDDGGFGFVLDKDKMYVADIDNKVLLQVLSSDGRSDMASLNATSASMAEAEERGVDEEVMIESSIAFRYQVLSEIESDKLYELFTDEIEASRGLRHATASPLRDREDIVSV